MTTRRATFFVDEYYHIYNRGNDKRTIFGDSMDYKRFMLLLYLCNSSIPVHISNYLNQGVPFSEIFNIDRGDQLVDIGAYCLMPNHFHLLLHEKIEGGISKFIEKLATAYVMYFNTKNERKGSLFEGTFKAKHIDNDAYLNWMLSYIHTNPIKLVDPSWKENGMSDSATVKSFIQNYKYSSYQDYFMGNRTESVILDKGAFPDHFSQLDDFEEMIKEFDSFSDFNQIKGTP